jgi:excisionase family DNA binding protein
MPGYVLSAEKMAQAMGVHRRTVAEWIAAGCPAQKSGRNWRMDTAAVMAWRLQRERQTALGEISNIGAEESKRRKLAADAASAELDVAIRSGAAVAIEDAEREWSEMIGAARNVFLGLGVRLAPQVALETDAAVCQSMIDGAVHEALANLSSDGAAPLPNHA